MLSAPIATFIEQTINAFRPFGVRKAAARRRRGLRLDRWNGNESERLQRVITVSLETMKIVNNLPKLEID